MERKDFVTQLMDLSLSLNQINKMTETKFGLSLAQWHLLKTLLEMPAVSSRDLAQALGVTPGTLTPALLRLERRGFLFVCSDPKDARRKMISITRTGKQALEGAQTELVRAFEGASRMNREVSEVALFLKDKVRARLAQP